MSRKNIMFGLFATLILGLTILIPFTNIRTDKDILLENKFGEIGINMNEGDVVEILGKPDFIHKNEERKKYIYFGIHKSGLGNLDYVVMFNAESKVTSKSIDRGS